MGLQVWELGLLSRSQSPAHPQSGLRVTATAVRLPTFPEPKTSSKHPWEPGKHSL